MTSPYSKPPPPIPTDLPAGRFGRWLYEFWDYVARNRLQAANGFVAGTGITVGTGTATFTLAHTTSGVAPGTFGNGTAVSQIVLTALGHVAAGTSLPITFPTPRALEATTPIAVATGAGTYTVSHNTSGVLAGTYGGTGVSLRLIVNAEGHLTSITTAS